MCSGTELQQLLFWNSFDCFFFKPVTYCAILSRPSLLFTFKLSLKFQKQCSAYLFCTERKKRNVSKEDLETFLCTNFNSLWIRRKKCNSPITLAFVNFNELNLIDLFYFHMTGELEIGGIHTVRWDPRVW